MPEIPAPKPEEPLHLFEIAGRRLEINQRCNPKGVSLWHSRSTLEKFLLVCSGVLLLTVLVMLSLIILDHQVPATDQSELCLSKSCIYTASEVIRALDQTKDPCDDFYEFACGGWIKNNPIPDGKSDWSTTSTLKLQNQLIIRNALDKVNTSDSTSAEVKAKIYYDACLDVNGTIETLGATPLLDVIKRLGGWYLLPQTMLKQTKFNLQKMLQQLQNRYGIRALIDWDIEADIHNSSRHVIVLREGSFDLPSRDHYLEKTANKKVLDAYLDYMTRICVLLGANKSEAKTHMLRVMDFEKDLVNITTPFEDLRDEESLYNPMTIAELQNITPFLNWITFFNDTFNSVNKTISEKERIVVYSPDYFKKLSTIISKYNETEEGQKTITSYIMWRVSRFVSRYLSESFRDADKVLWKALYGLESTEKMWRDCVEETNNLLNFAIGAMFVREVFHDETKRQGEVMIKNIRTAFKNNLKNLRWLDAETRHSVEVKADAITNIIGFPDYILDAPKLNQQYANLEVRPKQYFENRIQVKLRALKMTLSKLGRPVNKTNWGMNPSEINAYYSPPNNQILFPAGILQLPFYDRDNPKSINYGAIGFVMGHELTHGFDNEGRKYDRFGNMNQWWNNATIDQFKERATCIQNQYSNYSLEGQQLDGERTLGENIADNGGLKASFHAYAEYSRHAEKNYTLPGLNYTHRQMFFISFAHTWCKAKTKEDTKLQIETDNHTVAKYRIIGSLSNLREFSEEFNCPLGSKMNPKKKCEVW